MIERLFIDLGKGPSMFFMSPQMNRKIEETVRVVTYAKNTGQVKQKKIHVGIMGKIGSGREIYL